MVGAKSLGLHLHATLAVTESGLPLGVLRLGFDSTKARPPEAMERRRTKRWLDGFADIAKAAREVSRGTRVVAVCDREADCFEMFDAQRRNSRVDLLVRARHDRSLGPRRPKLFALMGGGAPDGLIDVEIDGLAARPKSSGRKARPARRKRLACCELRVRRAVLRRPEARDGPGMPRLRIRRLRRGDQRGACDRMKTAVLGEDADRSAVYNPSLVALLDHYGSAPKACRACRAKTKGKVERPFRCIRQDFFLDRTFRSLDDPDAQFDTWRGDVANPRVHATTGRIVDQAFAEEQCSLIPLPAYPLRRGPDRRAPRRPRRNGLRRRKPPFGAGCRPQARAGGAEASRGSADLRRQDADRPASGP